jgi:hypothetical protein
MDMVRSAFARVLAFALCFAACAHVVAAVTTTEDIIASYELISDPDSILNDTFCPSTLRTTELFFDQLVDNKFQGFDYFNIRIPFRNQKIGADICSGVGATYAVESDHPSVTDPLVLLEEWATGHGSASRSYIASVALLTAASKERFIYGYDYVERVCGKRSSRAGTNYLWFEAPTDIALNKATSLEKRDKYLLVSYNALTGAYGCVYKIGDSPGGGPTSDPSRQKGFTISKKGKVTNATETPEPTGEPADNAADKNTDDSSIDDFSGSVFGAAEAGKDDSGGNCFPASATVLLESGATKTMSELTIGDSVLVGVGKFSDVFMFTHALANEVNSFIELSTVSGDKLALSAGHYLYINGAMMSSETAKEGDTVELGSGASSIIASAKRVSMRGLYNPHTLHGDIVVDNVRTSTYTTAVQPTLAHSLLAPLRALFRVHASDPSFAVFQRGGDAVLSTVPSGNVAIA